MFRAFWLGVQERHSALGMTYDDDPESPRSRAYDWGRNIGEAHFPRTLTTLAVWLGLLAFSCLTWYACAALIVPTCDDLYDTAGRSQAELEAAHAQGDGLVGYDDVTACWYVD